MERDYDHGYVSLSPDDGATWTILSGGYSRSENPTGNAYGPSYSGVSGGGRTPQWVEERIDISPWAGQEVLVRFEYLTDQGTTLAGWLIDDIQVDGEGLAATYEVDQTSWEAQGFVRGPLVVPSRLLVQVGRGEGASLRVERYWLCYGESVTLTVGEMGERTFLALSGATRQTIEPLAYVIEGQP
jgi:hypothetical protein